MYGGKGETSWELAKIASPAGAVTKIQLKMTQKFISRKNTRNDIVKFIGFSMTENLNMIDPADLWLFLFASGLSIKRGFSGHKMTFTRGVRRRSSDPKRSHILMASTNLITNFFNPLINPVPYAPTALSPRNLRNRRNSLSQTGDLPKADRCIA